MEWLWPTMHKRDLEMGGHDGAYKGKVHVIVPFVRRNNGILADRQQLYNDVHGWYRAWIEQWLCLLCLLLEGGFREGDWGGGV